LFQAGNVGPGFGVFGPGWKVLPGFAGAVLGLKGFLVPVGLPTGEATGLGGAPTLWSQLLPPRLPTSVVE